MLPSMGDNDKMVVRDGRNDNSWEDNVDESFVR